MQKVFSTSSQQSSRNHAQIRFPGDLMADLKVRKGVEVRRDFPPFCGWNAPKPTEQELSRINSHKSIQAIKVVDHGILDDSVKRGQEKRPLDDADSLRYEIKNSRVHAKGSPNFPEELWRKGKGSTSKEKKRHPLFAHRAKFRRISFLKGALKSTAENFRDEEDCRVNSEAINESLPPFGPNNSNDARNRVRDTRRLFQAVCRKLLQWEEAKLRSGEEMKPEKQKVIYEAASYMRRERKVVNCDEKILGEVPGVEVGDQFQYRVELTIVGVHRKIRGGIDYMKHKGVIVATSIVASGGYDDELGNSDVLIYSGEGGNIGYLDRDKPAEDQKLIRGNLALKNSISAKTPVRVILGTKEIKTAESSKARGKTVMSYVYDGLYTVVDYKQVPGPRDNKMMFKFELRRIHGQPELSWKEVNRKPAV